MTTLSTLRVGSPLGTLAITGRAEGVSAISFVDDAPLSPPDAETLPVLAQCAAELAEYFAGTRRAFTVPLNLAGTAFQMRVWAALQAIPYGETRTYMDLARLLGDEKAVRAVGAANGQNPVAVIVPCHRVIGSDGSLTGYAGGLWRKEWLLAHEGRPIQQRMFS